MPMREAFSPRVAAAACLSFLLAGAAGAQQPPYQPGQPPLAGPGQPAQVAPSAPPVVDPLGQPLIAIPAETDWTTWWTAPEPLNELLDPLGRRRPGRGAGSPITAPVDASVYRLWGLTPLQTQVLKGDETVFEVWVRPTKADRQAVVRVVLRTDGRTFLQARAGRGCCAPGISRRVDIDRELPREARGAFRTLRTSTLWTQPRHVLVQEQGAVSGVCVDGVNYDLVRVEARRTVQLRRSCDPAEIGSVAPALRTLLAAAQGFDPRFDAAFKDVTFGYEERQYADLRARGGSLSPRQGNSDRVDAPEPAPAAEAVEVAEDDPGPRCWPPTAPLRPVPRRSGPPPPSASSWTPTRGG
jgi:hypothetical protein